MKNPIISQLILCIMFFFTVQTLFPQNQSLNTLVTSTSGVVTGIVIDVNEKPLEYSILYVLRVEDSMIVANGISDIEGKFVISPVPFGKFILKAESMGYKPIFSMPFTLSKSNPISKFPKFKITQKIESLDAVVVRADKEMLQSNLDKKVFNVGASIIAEGATAIEVLEEIPSIDVDLDGNVTLRGSENVTILVDGRATNLTLEQIPAEQIESIEVITNPSARLEPDGMAGILNVVLKKKRESGFNGMATIGNAVSFLNNNPYFDKYNANINLNYHVNKINIFLNYNFRKWGFHSMGSLDRRSWFENDTIQLIQANKNDGSGQGHNLQTGLDWYINAQNTLSFSFGYNLYLRTSNAELNSKNSKIINNLPLSYYSGFDQYSESNNVGHNFSGTLFYKKTFETKGKEFTADFLFSQRNNESETSELQDFIHSDSLPSFDQRTSTRGDNKIGTAQIDFITPVGNGGRIETGYKFSYRSTGQDYALYSGYEGDSLTEDLSQSNNFKYSEFINAGYFIYSNSFWEKLKVQVGLRAELANTFSDLKSQDTLYKNNYFNLFPTVHLRYDINTIHSLQVSYSRRVSRPRHWQLNPFRDYSDRQNQRQGNPNLKPEFVNSMELGYLMTYRKSSVNLTAFYRQRDDIITRFTELINDTTTLTTYQNLNKSQNLGFELTYGQRLWSFWRLSFTGSIYYENIESDNKLDVSLSQNLTWRFRINQNFSLPKNWDLQVNFRYSAPSLTTGSMGWGNVGVGQGKRQSRYSLNFGVKKSFLNKNLVVSLNARNILYRRENIINTYSFTSENGYEAVSKRYRDGLQFNLTLSYKFNNYKNRNDREKTNGQDEFPEMNED